MNKMINRFAAGIVMAIAAGVSLAPAPAHAAEAIDATRSGSLTIHKHVQDEQNSSPGSPAGKPLAGVEFVITAILYNGEAVNLSTAEGWARASTVIAGEAPSLPAGFTVGESVQVVTGSDGSVTAKGLPLGLYLVTETGFGDNNIAEPAVPFWVTVPMPGTAGGWDYDVVAYPKNELAAPTPSPTETPTPKPTAPDSGGINTGIPGLGEANPLAVVAGLGLLVAAALLAAAAVLRRRRRRPASGEAVN